MEYNNHGEGAANGQRVSWSRQLTRKEAEQVTMKSVFTREDTWIPNN
jgi:pectinesterase